MKKYLIILVGMGMLCCSKSSPDFAVDCSGTPKSFSTDVLPVFQSSCTSCHSSNGSQFSLENYSQIFQNKSKIRSVVINGFMPTNKKLTNEEVNKIICWIDNGTPNN